MAKKFLRPSIIVMMVIAVLCIPVFIVFTVLVKKAKNQFIDYFDSLPVICTKEEILEAVKSPDEKTYVIESYSDFDNVETVSDPYGLIDGDYIYFEIGYRTIEERHLIGTDEYEKHPYDELEKTTEYVRGRLFIDENTELDISGASVLCIQGSGEKEWNVQKYFYDYIEPGRKMSFIASLGNNKAKALKMGSGNSSFFRKTAPAPMSYVVPKWLSLTLFVILLLVVYGDYMVIKDEAKKREQRLEQRRRSKQGQKK